MSDCVFCGIARCEVATERVWESEEFLAFRDNSPQAKHHVLVIPRQHVDSLAGFEAADPAVAGRFLQAAIAVSRQLELLEPGLGFRLVANTGPDGGQTVPHVHLHVLGGRDLHWPPG